MEVSPNHLDREAKIKIFSFAAALRDKTKKGQRGLTCTHLDVLHVLLRLTGNSIDPEVIAARAACSRTSVHDAIKALELVGVLIAERRGRVLSTITFVVPEQSVLMTPSAARLDREG
jgi:biotin operon repressor